MHHELRGHLLGQHLQARALLHPRVPVHQRLGGVAQVEVEEDVDSASPHFAFKR
jgi:hypothetical protein